MLARHIYSFLGIVIAHEDDNLLIGRVFSSYVNPRPRYSRIVKDQLVELFNLVIQEFQEIFLDFEDIIDIY